MLERPDPARTVLTRSEWAWRSESPWRPGLAWAGYAAAGCAVLRLPLHVYYGLGGTAGLSTTQQCAADDCGFRVVDASTFVDPMVGALPDAIPPALAELAWRSAHLGTALLLAAVAALALALVRPWGRRLPSAALIVPAFAVTVVALSYAFGAALAGAGRLATRVTPELLPSWDALAAVGPSAPERAILGYAQWLGGLPLSAYPMAGLTAVGPWALALGLLVAAAAAHRLARPAARRVWVLVVALGVLRLLAG